MLRSLATVIITGSIGTCAGCPGIEFYANDDGGNVSVQWPDAATNGGAGGSASGGASSGGSDGTGGMGTGGANSGGASTGGASTGGSASGGASTGGASSGGSSTGGAASGGMASGGGSTGGAASGGRPGTGGTAGATTAALFVGDFETGNLSQWSYVEQCKTDRILVYDALTMPAGAPVPRQGRYAARFRVLDSDIAPCTSTENPRAELETPETLFKPGDERWESWSVFMPTDKPATQLVESWFLFQEDYGAPWDGPPGIGWIADFDANEWRIDHDGGVLTSLPMVTGRWTDFLVHKKFANTNAGGGYIEAWVDGTPFRFPGSVTKYAVRTMHTTQKSLGFYISSYRERGLFATFDIFVDAVRVGATRESVSP